MKLYWTWTGRIEKPRKNTSGQYDSYNSSEFYQSPAVYILLPFSLISVVDPNHWIWIRIQDFGPIWIRIHNTAIYILNIYIYEYIDIYVHIIWLEVFIFLYERIDFPVKLLWLLSLSLCWGGNLYEKSPTVSSAPKVLSCSFLPAARLREQKYFRQNEKFCQIRIFAEKHIFCGFAKNLSGEILCSFFRICGTFSCVNSSGRPTYILYIISPFSPLLAWVNVWLVLVMLLWTLPTFLFPSLQYVCPPPFRRFFI